MPTIYDVAKLAGVSPKTVSRVINNDVPVVEKTRKKVENAIAELGYVPSTAARSMRSNKSGLVGLITGAISQFSEPRTELTGLPDLYIVQGVQQMMQASGKTLLIADVGDSGGDVQHLFRTFKEHRVEGLIYVARNHRQVDFPVESLKLSTVLANCFDQHGTTAVVPDDESGQRRLVDSIIEHGHTRIAYLTLDPALVATQLRVLGYRSALESAGLPYDPDLVICADSLSLNDWESQIQQAISHLFALNNPPTVICCGNDKMALHLYGLLRVRGIKIPEDISIAGFDNYVAIAESLFPSLTTVDLAYRRIGQEAASLLLAKMSAAEADASSSGPRSPLRVEGPLVWRHSVSGL